MTQTEDRLRAAFAARAAQVTHADLRRAAPPHGPRWGVRRMRHVAYALVGAAAAVVAVCLLVLLPGSPLDPVPVPVPPAQSPRTGEPARPTTGVIPGPAPAVTRTP
ncbi:hypothetical protein OG897_07570 [Streptomyces sp. NBC_00237]|uniref:hypothetical protein n=1 Tax=Streptomyces sp. NBC_00237 TaxID=2975687 RepID=UPI00225967BE|nr:hypothetical protein [Streptomyces sp. NBC_00237]MCX5201312.1 hypothetical protein [Streptomyces sp. NBC_00237]